MSENKNPALDPDGTLPRLEGWVGITEAGDMLGFTRQYAYRMAKERVFKTLHRIGDSHVIVVSTKEVEQMRDARSEKKDEG